MGYGILRVMGARRGEAMVGAAVVSAAAGIGKEIWDGHGHGTVSGRDLVWDGVGIVAGAQLARIGDPP